MLTKFKTLINAISRFFVQKPSADLTWRWVWDETTGKAIKQDKNPWLAYYATPPATVNPNSDDSLKEPDFSSDWDSQKFIQFSQEKSQGYFPGISQKSNPS